MDISLASITAQLLSFSLLGPLLLGIGGGIIAIPVLVMGFGMEQQLAQGLALMLLATAALMIRQGAFAGG